MGSFGGLSSYPLKTRMNRNLILAVLLLIIGCNEKEDLATESYVLHRFMQTTAEGDELMTEIDYENGRISRMTSYFNNEISHRRFYTYADNFYRIYRANEAFDSPLAEFDQELQFDSEGRLTKRIQNDYSNQTGEYSKNVNISTYEYRADSIFEKWERFLNEANPPWTAVQNSVFVKDANNNLVYESKDSHPNEVYTYEMTYSDLINPHHNQTGYELPETSQHAISGFKFFIDDVLRNERHYLYKTNEQGLISTSISGYDTIQYEYTTILR